MNFFLRREEPDDYFAVENLIREAFWDVYRPGCNEHLMAHKMRSAGGFVPELGYVAEIDGDIAGSILYMKSQILSICGTSHDVLTLGPLSVAPARQKQGIGSALVEQTVEKAAEMDFAAVFIFGNPAYYRRFGFINAKKYDITTLDGHNFDAFMALELAPGALGGITGKYITDPVYDIDPDELSMFDRLFPKKEAHITETQLFRPSSAIK